MTTANLRTPKPTPAAKASALVVRWNISVDSLIAAAPGLLNGQTEHARAVALEWHISTHGNAAQARASILVALDNGQTERLPLNGVANLPDAALPVISSLDRETGLRHLDAGPALRITLRGHGAGSAEGEIVYASTSALAALGLPGGVYDAPTLG